MKKIVNPHDKLFRETWSDLKEARSFLENYLPADILELTDMRSLEICKDTFIEEELRDAHTDLLYRVKFENEPGYVYLLFEHKSYKDRFISLQLLGYMCNIWKLHLKQSGDKRLPIIAPLVLYHGQTQWQVDAGLASLMAGPYEKLKAYVPDFKYQLYDLTRFSDDQIKGAILSRVVLLLFKHITDADIVEKLPGIIALFDDLLKEESGLRNLETVLRYLAATVENVTPDEMKTAINNALSGGKGDIIMTLAEQWIQEGFQKGIQQGMQEGMQKGIQQGVQQGMQKGMQKGIQQGVQQGMQVGVREGLLEGIVLAIQLKFGVNPESDRLIHNIQKMRDLERIKSLKQAILKAGGISELVEITSE